jgi:hypothetical protein
MPSNDEWRRLLGNSDLTDAEVAAFVRELRAFLGQFLDDYFRDEFRPDEV